LVAVFFTVFFTVFFDVLLLSLLRLRELEVEKLAQRKLLMAAREQAERDLKERLSSAANVTMGKSAEEEEEEMELALMEAR
jgi:hypothetical protein